MIKTVNIEGKEVPMKASALLPRLYRAKFGRDMIADITKLKKTYKDSENFSFEVLENLAYMMAKHADKDNVPESVEDWLDQFETTFSLYQALPQIFEVWNNNSKTTSVAAKK